MVRASNKKHGGGRDELMSFSWNSWPWCLAGCLCRSALNPVASLKRLSLWRDHKFIALSHRFQPVHEALYVVGAGPPAAFGFASATHLSAPPPTLATSAIGATTASQRSVCHCLDEVFVSNVPVFPTLQLEVEEVGGGGGPISDKCARPDSFDETCMFCNCFLRIWCIFAISVFTDEGYGSRPSFA